MLIKTNRDIYVLGAGYAGVYTALRLASRHYYVHWVNPEPYHELVTEIYDVIEHETPSRVRVQIDNLIDRQKINFIQDRLVKFTPNSFILEKQGEIHLRNSHVFNCTGKKTNHREGFRTADHALKVAKKIRELDHTNHIQIIGAGSVAVELASYIHDFYLKEGTKNPRISLVSEKDNGKLHLPQFSSKAIEEIENRLKLGRIYLKSEKVKNPDCVFYANGLLGKNFEESSEIYPEFTHSIINLGDVSEKVFSAHSTLLQAEYEINKFMGGDTKMRKSLAYILKLPRGEAIGKIKTPFGYKEFINPLMYQLKKAAYLRYRINLFRLSERN